MLEARFSKLSAILCILTPASDFLWSCVVEEADRKPWFPGGLLVPFSEKLGLETGDSLFA